MRSFLRLSVLAALVGAALAAHQASQGTICSSQVYNLNPETQLNNSSPFVSLPLSLHQFCCQSCEQRSECWSWDWVLFDEMRWFNSSYNETENFVGECRLFGLGNTIINRTLEAGVPEDVVADPAGGYQEFRYNTRAAFSYLHPDCSQNNTVLYHCGASICVDFKNECDGEMDCPGHYCPDGWDEADCLQACNVTINGFTELCPIDEVDCTCQEFLIHPNNTNTAGVDWRDYCDGNCTFQPEWYVKVDGSGAFDPCPHSTGELSGGPIEGVCEPGFGACPDDCSTPGACDDPHFVGFGGGMYDVQGEADKAFNLISSEHVSVNSLYLLQTEGFSDAHHPEWAGSTYLGPMGVHSYNSFFTLYPDCSAVVNDVYSQRLRMDQDPLELLIRDELSGEVVAMVEQDTFEFRVRLPEFILVLQCTGHGGTSYFNMRATYYKSPQQSQSALQPHGLLGQTTDGVWRPSCRSCLQGEGAIDGLYLDYVVGEGVNGLRSTDFKYSRFAPPSRQTVSDAVALGSMQPGAIIMHASGFGSASDEDIDPMTLQSAADLRLESSTRAQEESAEVQLF